MAKIVFVKIRNDQGEIYSSYCDFWQLVNLSGFDTCELDEVDIESDNTYIASPPNGNVKACFDRPHKAKLIVWQLERTYDKTTYGDEVWVSDRYLAEKMGAKYVTMGGHPKLGVETIEYKDNVDYDYAPVSYLYGRREHIVEQIKREGGRVAPMVFSKEDKDKILKNTRYGLALHQDDLPIIEPLRYTLFSCYGLPIVAEKSMDFYPYKVIKYPQLHAGNTKELAEYNHTLMTKIITFRKSVEENA